jgi:cytochrome P450
MLADAKTLSPAPTPRTAPGPRTWIPGGSFWEFRKDRLGFVTTMARQYGDLAAFQFGRQRVFLISKPEWIEDVLVTSAKKYAKGVALERSRRVLGKGLLTNEGADHLRQRRTIQPLFHRQHVQTFANAFVKHADRWAASVQPDSTLDMTAAMSALTLGIVGETLFSSDVAGQADDVREALADVVAGFELIFLPFLSVLEQSPIPAFVKMRKARERLDAIIRGVVAERRAELAGISQSTASSLSRNTHVDLVTMLAAARDPENPQSAGMSDEQIRDEAMTIFLAGHETTANAMAWTWHLLAHNPDAERALHDELTRVLAGRTPAADDVPRLEMTRAIVAESMRLYPPAWTMGRRALEPHTIDGCEIKRGDLILMSQYVVHRDPRWWEAPDEFRPSRWITPQPARHKYAYFPFGGGSRICIGESFAWTEAILLLAVIAQRWRFAAVDGGQPVPQARITLRPTGLKMRALPIV